MSNIQKHQQSTANQEIIDTIHNTNTAPEALPQQIITAIATIPNKYKVYAIALIQHQNKSKAAEIALNKEKPTQKEITSFYESARRNQQLKHFHNTYSQYIEMQQDAVCSSLELQWMYSSIVRSGASNNRDKMAAAKALRELQGYDKPAETGNASPKVTLSFAMGNSGNNSFGGKLQDAPIDVELL